VQLHLGAGESIVGREALEVLRRPGLAGGEVFLLARPAVLEPHLSDPFTEAGYLSNPLEVLTVRVAVYLEIGLKYLNLFFSEGCPHPFCFLLLYRVFRISTLIGGGEAAALQRL